FLYRMGGEEFLILSITKDSHGGAVLAEKTRIATSKLPVEYKGQQITVTVSCGLSHCHGDEAPEASLNHLLSRADKALYAAKGRGRNQICTYENMIVDQVDPPPRLVRKKQHMGLVATPEVD
ncbi:GGDEF domain-containing protein, partial [Pseudomonadota bacterium]